MSGGAEQENGRPAWPAAEGLYAGRGAGAAAGAAAVSARDDEFEPPFEERDRDRGDYPHRDERVARDEGQKRGFFGRGDKRPRVGETRKGRDEEEVPSWERPRRYDAYPTLKTRVGLRGISKVVIAALLLFAAAIAVFLLPGVLGFGKPSTSPGGGGGVVATASPPAVEPSASEVPSAAPTATPFTYTVVPKDTLTKIARKFGVTVDQILAANPKVTDPNKVSIGDKLVIPTPAPSGASPAP
jgi:hypothetical protein